MKFQIGDPVVLKHTGEEGKIIGIENEEMFLVLIEGVEIPVFKENIDHPYFDWFTKEKDKKKKLKFVHAEQIPVETQSKNSIIDQGLFIGFFPVYKDLDSGEILKFRIYLIDQQNERLKFDYRLSREKKNLFSIKGEIIPYTNFYIHDVAMDLMHLQPVFRFTFDKDKTKYQSQSVELKIRSKKLFEYLKILEEGSTGFFQIPISLSTWNELSNEIEIEWKSTQQLSGSAQKILSKKIIEEVDLHIEQLTKDYHHLSNAEIIQMQLTVFHQVLDKAMASGQAALTVIHGVGKGVLKEEIHKILKSTPEVRYFISDWMPKYGAGATQVFF